MMSGTGPSAGGVSCRAHSLIAARRSATFAGQCCGPRGGEPVDQDVIRSTMADSSSKCVSWNTSSVSREEAVLRQQGAELADLVEEQVRVPVLAVELVPLDVGEHAMRERDHLVVGAAFLVGAQQLAVVRDELAALGLQLFDRAFE